MVQTLGSIFGTPLFITTFLFLWPQGHALVMASYNKRDGIGTDYPSIIAVASIFTVLGIVFLVGFLKCRKRNDANNDNRWSQTLSNMTLPQIPTKAALRDKSVQQPPPPRYSSATNVEIPDYTTPHQSRPISLLRPTSWSRPISLLRPNSLLRPVSLLRPSSLYNSLRNSYARRSDGRTRSRFSFWSIFGIPNEPVPSYQDVLEEYPPPPYLKYRDGTIWRNF